MKKNNTVLFKNGVAELLEKDRIFETELTFSGEDGAVREQAPTFAVLDKDRTLAELLSPVSGSGSLLSHAIKLQCNRGGGGSFPMHLDTDVCDCCALVTLGSALSTSSVWLTYE